MKMDWDKSCIEYIYIFIVRDQILHKMILIDQLHLSAMIPWS